MTRIQRDNIILRRVYADSGDPGEAKRFLVDRLWPRGVKREELRLDAWLKEAAPSNELRKWYHAEPERWEEFRARYFAELDQNPQGWQPLLDAAAAGAAIVLLYSSKEEEHNNAAALKEYIEMRLG